MFTQRFMFESCRACTDLWNGRNSKPPCIRAQALGPQGLMVVRVGEIGGTSDCCPCIISYTELKTYMAGGATGARMSTEAQGLMKVIHARMDGDTQKRWINDPTWISFVEPSMTHNNFRGYLMANPPDVPSNLTGNWHFVRRLADSEMVQLNEFRGANAMDADWDDWQSKYMAVWGMAKPLIAQRGLGQLTAMFSDPAAVSVMIASIAVMFGPQGVLLGAFRTILTVVGFGAQAFQLAGLLKDFASETYYARRPDDLKRAAGKLADFLAMIITLGLGFLLAKGVEKWQAAKAQAIAEHGTAPEPVGGAKTAGDEGGGGVPVGTPGGKGKPGQLAEYKPETNYRDELPKGMKVSVEDLSKQSGVQPFHIGDWCRLARENGWFVVLRTGKVAGLKLHFDEMSSAAKGVLVKWKANARTGMIHRPMGEDIVETIYEKEVPVQYASRNGLPIPHTPEELAAFKVKYKPQLDAWKTQNKFAWYWSKEANSAVLTVNGRIICSDYDKMGIYEHAESGWRPQAQWAAHNDSPTLQGYINKYIRGGAQMDQHGCQDFSGGPTGRPVRQPGTDERFLIFEPPNGTPRMVESVGELKALYQKYGVRWPYDV